MRREYSKRVAPLLIQGLVLSLLLAGFATKLSDGVSGVLASTNFLLYGLGFYYWALAKGQSTANFFWALFPPLGLIFVALLPDEYKDEPPDGVDPNEPVKNCPRCGAAYRESDYGPDAEMVCSRCWLVLPRTGAQATPSPPGI